jgi:nitrilase
MSKTIVAVVPAGSRLFDTFDLDVVGHYSRADLFTLNVDDRPQQPVLFTTLEE